MYRFLLLIILLPMTGRAQLKLAKVFSDNMVLQRDKPIHIWGKALPGKTVKVLFAGHAKSAKVRIDSSWNIFLASMDENADPQDFAIYSEADTIELHNILIGDIWLCIGQSNMEFPLIKESSFSIEKQLVHYPRVRFYNPTYAGKNIYGTTFTDSVVRLLEPTKFYSGQWQACDSNTFKTMSAVAYYFGKKISNEINVPIGLINLSIGGAPLEAFIDEKSLKESKRFSAKVNGDWLTNDELPVWVRERGTQNVLDAQNVPMDENGKNHAYKPGFAYKTGIRPLLPLYIRGILCYQGESNAQEMDRVVEYADLCKLMIDDYRKKWNDEKLPFYFVQISSIDTLKYNSQLWPQFRNEQRKILDLVPYCGMAVCSEIGARDDVHPTDKKDVGERLARWALNKTYKKDIVPSGPLPIKANCRNGYVVVTFRYSGSQLTTTNGEKLNGFSLNGKEPVDAIIKNSCVLIRSENKPAFVYYGWKPYSDGNLINGDDLPASTFKIRVN